MKKIKENIGKYYQDMIFVLVVSLAVLCILLDIVQVFAFSTFYIPYIIILPTLVVIILRILYAQRKSDVINNICYALGISIVEYLILILFGKISCSIKMKVFVYIITALYLLMYNNIRDCRADIVNNVDRQREDNRKIFSLYYINTEKVYEIAMLLNNKIVTSGTTENETEASINQQTDIGISSNLNYLKSIKGELEISQNMQTHSGIKNKVLENFDVKTTKSNMLASILSKAKEFEDYKDMYLGDLVLLKDASLKLLNEEESYAVTKMILNGAFKDAKISSNSDDMNFEFDLSSMINSLLKDCVYELECTVGGDNKYLLTIPMTFENDFENSYNIYDLQVGRVSVVGIYRGNRQYEKRMSLQEIFSEENKQKQNNIYEDKEFQLISSTKKQSKNLLRRITWISNQKNIKRLLM